MSTQGVAPPPGKFSDYTHANSPINKSKLSLVGLCEVRSMWFMSMLMNIIIENIKLMWLKS